MLAAQGCIQDPTQGLLNCFIAFSKELLSDGLTEHKEHAAQAPVVPLPLQGAPYSPFSECLSFMDSQSSDSRGHTGGIISPALSTTLRAALGAEQDRGHTKATSPEWALATVALCSTSALTAACCRKSHPNTSPGHNPIPARTANLPSGYHTPSGQGRALPLATTACNKVFQPCPH